jgi:hypothetical protein
LEYFHLEVNTIGVDLIQICLNQLYIFASHQVACYGFKVSVFLKNDL